MDSPFDIEIAERALKDTTERYESLLAHVYGINNEITLLLHIKKTLEENISVLKDRQIITVAVEYKRAKDDLRKVYNNLSMLRINKNNLEHSVEQARKFMVECRQRYVHAIETQSCKIIEVDFGRKSDRQSGNTP
jgi:hypothetical protein